MGGGVTGGAGGDGGGWGWGGGGEGDVDGGGEGDADGGGEGDADGGGEGGGGDGGGGDGAVIAWIATDGAAMLSIVTPSCVDRSDVDVLCSVLAVLSAADALAIIRRTVTVTLPAATVMTASSASGN